MSLHRQLQPSHMLLTLHGPCVYAFTESLGEESMVIHQGEAVTLAVGMDTLRLLMNTPPPIGHILEVNLRDSNNRSTIALLHVERTTHVHTEDDGERHVVEGRFVFGPYCWLQHEFLPPLSLARKVED